MTLRLGGHSDESQKELHLAKTSTGRDVITKALDAFGLSSPDVDDYAIYVLHGEQRGTVMS